MQQFAQNVRMVQNVRLGVYKMETSQGGQEFSQEHADEIERVRHSQHEEEKVGGDDPHGSGRKDEDTECVSYQSENHEYQRHVEVNLIGQNDLGVVSNGETRVVKGSHGVAVVVTDVARERGGGHLLLRVVMVMEDVAGEVPPGDAPRYLHRRGVGCGPRVGHGPPHVLIP